MNILLIGINAKYIHSNPAIYSLAAYAAKQGLAKYVSLAEYTINQQREHILADIFERQPDVAAFSCYIWNIDMVKHLIEEIHQVLPATDIWVGGPEVSFHPEQLFNKFPFLKGVMIGEGEKTFSELVEHYVAKEDGFSSIAGLYLPDGYTAERECMNLDEIPFFYDYGKEGATDAKSTETIHASSDVELPERSRKLTDFQNRIVYYESSRGCPFRCSYCLSSIEKKLRFRSFNLVQEELAFFLKNEVPQVKFIDRTFNAGHEHCMAIWSYIKEHDNGITNFHFEISADLLRDEEIALLQSMREGLVQLEIGVQTTNSDTILAINRTMNLDKLASAVSQVRKNGNIHQHLDLIAGLPYEDYESFHKSFNDVYSMRPQQLQLGFLKVLKGSSMEEKAQEYGIVYHKEPPYEVLYTKWMPYRDVLRLKQIEEMVELFYNSGQFAHSIAFLEYLISDAFVMFERLAAYYKKKGLLLISSKRIAHYENFLSFIEEEFPDYTALFKELLVFDCYLRENMKTYPEFVGNHEIHVYGEGKKDSLFESNAKEKSESNAKEKSEAEENENVGGENRAAEYEVEEVVRATLQYEKDYSRSFYQAEEENRKYLPNHMSYDSRQMAKMTHMEFFKFPVWEQTPETLLRIYKEKNTGTQLTTGSLYPVLFDYSTRHYTSGSCRTVVL